MTLNKSPADFSELSTWDVKRLSGAAQTMASVTISSIKQAFPKLRAIPAERIAISAFIGDLDDTLHISEHIWPEVLPDLKHVTIVLDSADPNVAESQTVAVTTDVDPIAPRTPDSSSSTTRSSPNSPAKPKWFLPGTIPFQPYDWRGLDRRRIVIACYSNLKSWIMITPQTTIDDLKTFIGMRLRLDQDAKYEYHYGKFNISSCRTVGELQLVSDSYNQIQVTRVV
ncbi:hypothetical protein FRC10_004966 [Ceratobasidium sp. 414]|nr:hypothetical protein FRC10_004966 [Ceratobasidium sp. 414]